MTASDQASLRKALRIERRMEFAGERLRMYDLRRWRIAEKLLNGYEWGFAYNKKTALEALGGNFIDFVPPIDEDGIPDMSGLSSVAAAQTIHERHFYKESGYLWPIPTNDVLVSGGNVEQNPGY